MNAELKRLHSPDVYDLENYKPESPANFSFLLQAMIGPVGEDGGESFDIEVCTPKWIEENCAQDVVIIGSHYLIVREYNYKKIIESIRIFLLGCAGEDWGEVARKVSRLGLWEFEGYES
ncbi:immunity 8 family protein [Pseudomonas sp. TNT2022 ID1048]|uniref:immunity 8 family protein n=1 Tax=Pseudomonas idahonensis TaxID=2942628 RepID=UPI00236178C4|nr:immunity 8 family protein [Pseudomonas idahonensis]MDD1020248.1 immunity 8 family protein [Pseudomonas idahonensis]